MFSFVFQQSRQTLLRRYKSELVLSPAVQRLVSVHALDVSRLTASGPRGHILKSDVLAFLNGQQEAPAVATEKPVKRVEKNKTKNKPVAVVAAAAAAAQYDDIPLTNMRKIIGFRLLESKQNVPHSYATAVCDLEPIVALRKTLNQSLQSPSNNSNSDETETETQSKLSVNDFVVKAAATALMRVSDVNVSYDVKSDSIVRHESADISIAVATDDGLITPIVHGAHQKGLRTISDEVREMAGRARINRLKPHEFQGGTFTISNLGMFGIANFKAVINPPQAAILAVGGPVHRIVVGDSADADDSAHVARVTTMSVTLSYDRRAIDEHSAGHFLDVFQALMQHPNGLLL
jgi:pyruvate dehydrogenase E2 component (dihydrolipoyllysine-residue acetyltransferase)